MARGQGSIKGAVVAIAIIAAIGYWGIIPMLVPKAAGGGPQDFAMPVQMAAASTRSLDVVIDSVGTLVANESVTLRPEIVGRITEIGFTEGQPIKKGTKLFQIDDRMARAELKQAESNLKLARLNFERFRKLSSTGAATKQRYDEASAQLGVSQANVDLARTRIDYAAIKAPFDGVVGLRSVSPGDYVNVGQDLANYVSYDPMKVNFSIPETQASKLAIDQALDIVVEALPGETFHGIVYALDPQLDVSGRAVSLRAMIPNPDMKLKPGYFARIHLIVNRKENAITIPESAIVPQGNSKNVFLVGADGTVSVVPVEIGERLAGEVEILSGLSAGDKVVTSGQIKLRPGAKVMDITAMQAPKAEEGEAVPAAEAEDAPPADDAANVVVEDEGDASASQDDAEEGTE